MKVLNSDGLGGNRGFTLIRRLKKVMRAIVFQQPVEDKTVVLQANLTGQASVLLDLKMDA